MDGWMDGWWMDGWMDGEWMDGWMHRWIDGWVGIYKNGCIKKLPLYTLYIRLQVIMNKL